jgi:hypothetical protein
MRSASALRFSKGCSSLNLERMLIEFVWIVCRDCSVMYEVQFVSG